MRLLNFPSCVRNFPKHVTCIWQLSPHGSGDSVPQSHIACIGWTHLPLSLPRALLALSQLWDPSCLPGAPVPLGGGHVSSFFFFSCHPGLEPLSYVSRVSRCYGFIRRRCPPLPGEIEHAGFTFLTLPFMAKARACCLGSPSRGAYARLRWVAAVSWVSRDPEHAHSWG